MKGREITVTALSDLFQQNHQLKGRGTYKCLIFWMLFWTGKNVYQMQFNFESILAVLSLSVSPGVVRGGRWQDELQEMPILMVSAVTQQMTPARGPSACTDTKLPVTDSSFQLHLPDVAREVPLQTLHATVSSFWEVEEQLCASPLTSRSPTCASRGTRAGSTVPMHWGNDAEQLCAALGDALSRTILLYFLIRYKSEGRESQDKHVETHFILEDQSRQRRLTCFSSCKLAYWDPYTWNTFNGWLAGNRLLGLCHQHSNSKIKKVLLHFQAVDMKTSLVADSKLVLWKG